MGLGEVVQRDRDALGALGPACGPAPVVAVPATMTRPRSPTMTPSQPDLGRRTRGSDRPRPATGPKRQGDGVRQQDDAQQKWDITT